MIGKLLSMPFIVNFCILFSNVTNHNKYEPVLKYWKRFSWWTTHMNTIWTLTSSKPQCRFFSHGRNTGKSRNPPFFTDFREENLSFYTMENTLRLPWGGICDFFSSSNSNLAIIDVQLLSQLVTHFLIEFLPFREIASVPKRLYTYMSFYREQLKNKKRAKKVKNGGTITPHTFRMSFC